MRWLYQNRPVQAPRGQQPEVDPFDFGKEVAAAVDAYADKKREELEQALRRTAREALDGNYTPVDVRVSAKGLLESECMTFIAGKVTTGMGRPSRFPVNLHT